MLPSPAHVREAYLGPAGILSRKVTAIYPAVLVDSSTIDPETVREIAEAASSTSLHPESSTPAMSHPTLIDAPVSGGVPGALNATLTFMVRTWLAFLCFFFLL